MSEDIWIAIISSLGGGATLKGFDVWLAKSKEKNADVMATRKELRDEIDKLRKEVDELRDEVDEWKAKYFDLREHMLRKFLKLGVNGDEDHVP